MQTQHLESLAIRQPAQDQERIRRRHGVLTELSLRDENRLFADTRGVSHCNRDLGFVPGYLNRATGMWVLSRMGDGTPAPVHLLDGLPDDWVSARDATGHVVTVRPEVIAGFIRNATFYTREEAVRADVH